MSFYKNNHPHDLIKTYGSPLYVYNEDILRTRCREMMGLSTYPHFVVNYAMKANTNLHLLSIVREEGLHLDISSVGEAVAAKAAGFTPHQMMFILNGAAPEELQYAIDIGATVSVDSLSQLETYGKLNPGGNICLRFNAGVGGGHHEKVITGGDGTKFGIMPQYIPQVEALLEKYQLQLIGINHHVGSQNSVEVYMDGVHAILDVARHFPNLAFVDLGGGFAIPYHKQDGEQPIDLARLGTLLDTTLHAFAKDYGKALTFMIEPGRYIVAECGVLLGTVHGLKTCGAVHYAGTDIGFSVFARPTLYDAHHDIEIYPQTCTIGEENVVTIVGNQCESGDYVAQGRTLPPLEAGDILGVMDAGAYGYSMASQYNMRQRPAEVLIQTDGHVKKIRHRDTFEDMLRNMGV